MKPRILITMHYLELGGAETSLIGLLGTLDPERVDVDLFIHSHQGPLMHLIPSWVNLLPEKPSYAVIERPFKEAVKRGQLGVALGRLIAKFRHKAYIKRNKGRSALDASEFQYVADCVEPFLPPINPVTTYDLAISFLSPHNYVLHKVKARKRLAWIHTDYSTVTVNVPQELPLWDAFDNIASISPQVTETFLQTFPSLAPKIIEIENILSPEFVRSRADEFSVETEMPRTEESINLLSIGRFTYQKNFENIPKIARILVTDFGLKNLRWYIVGYGYEESILRAIEDTCMQDHVIILGKKDNPYPYIKACDIYVQPSRFEGKSVTVREAQMLRKPVVVTDYPTAKSQIRSDVDGIIVPMDNASCAHGIADFIGNTELRKKIISNLHTLDFGNTSEVNKIYKLIE